MPRQGPGPRYASARGLHAALRTLSDASSTTVAEAADGTPDAKKSIAVLPFENHSADPGNEYFSDGLTDEIISDLSQIRSPRVISRHSSMQVKASGKDLKAVSHELNAAYLLQGSVRRAANAVRVTAQLIDPVRDDTSSTRSAGLRGRSWPGSDQRGGPPCARRGSRRDNGLKSYWNLGNPAGHASERIHGSHAERPTVATRIELAQVHLTDSFTAELGDDEARDCPISDASR